MGAANTPPSLPGRLNSPVLIAQVPVSLAPSGSTALGLGGASGLYSAARRIVITDVIVEDPSTSSTLATTTVRLGTSAGAADVMTTATLPFTASGSKWVRYSVSATAGAAFVQGTDVYFDVIANGVASATAKVTLLGYIE
jgi:hypothetical protein